MAKEKQDKMPLLIAVIVLGLVAIFLISSTFQFKDKVFKTLFPKSRSLADVNSMIPSVNLKINYQSSLIDGVLNVTSNNTPVILSWETKGNPTSCVGRSWGISDIDRSFDGPKNPQGGSFTTKKLIANNPYVYSIDCVNNTGDSSGDSVTINVGAKQNNIAPYITSLKLITNDGKTYDSSEVISLNQGSIFKINWTSLNTNTPYSICVATGSWPIGYKNVTGSTVSDQYIVKLKKIYKFNVYCSNETESTQNSLTIF